MNLKLYGLIPIVIAAAIVGLAFHTFAPGRSGESLASADTVQDLERAYRELAQEVLTISKYRNSSYLSLVRIAETISRKTEELASKSMKLDADSQTGVPKAIDACLREAVALLSSVEGFKSSNTIYHNSLRYLSELMRDIDRLKDIEHSSLVAEAHERLEQLYLESWSGGSLAGAPTFSPHTPLSSRSDAAKPAVRERLELFHLHLQKVVETRSAVDRQVETIINAPIARCLNDLSTLLASQAADDSQRQQLVHHGLIITAGALVAYVITLLWQLRVAARELNVANSTLQHRVEERTKELQMTTLQLLQAQKLESIGQMAAGIAHEINTPMQFLSGNIEFLSECSKRLFEVVDGYQENLFSESRQRSWAERKQDLTDMIERNQFSSIREQVPQAIEESVEGIQRVIHIVRAMKEFSHPGQEEKVGVDLNNAVTSTATIARNRWKYVADLEFALDPDLPTLKCVPGEINQLLLNLIVNAADAIAEKLGENSAEKGLIVVRTRSDEENVVIEVEDSGCGIPEEIRNRIFDPFFTTKDVGKGTGQGLSICYNVVVNKHQGTIDVLSTPGEGTTFRVFLPRIPQAPEEVATDSADVSPPYEPAFA